MTCDVNVVKVWEGNMKALGLPVPTDTYGAGLGSLGAISLVAGVVETHGSKVLLSRAFAQIGLGGIATIGAALYASYWTGAAIGSVAVAAGNKMSCGATITDAMWTARSQFKIYGIWLEEVFYSNPELLRAH